MQNYSLVEGLLPEITNPRFFTKEATTIRTFWHEGQSPRSLEDEFDFVTMLDNAVIYTGGFQIKQSSNDDPASIDASTEYVRASLDLIDILHPFQVNYLDYHFGSGSFKSLEATEKARSMLFNK